MTPEIRDIALLISIVFNLILFWRTSGHVSPELVAKLFELAKDATARTPSLDDDKLIEELRGMFNVLLNAPPPSDQAKTVISIPNGTISQGTGITQSGVVSTPTGTISYDAGGVTVTSNIPPNTTISYTSPQDFDSPVIP